MPSQDRMQEPLYTMDDLIDARRGILRYARTFPPSRPAPNEISIVRSHYRSADLLETGTGSMPIPFKQPRRQSKAMLILAILGLILTLAGCTGERFEAER
jgi:hypothetical protein